MSEVKMSFQTIYKKDRIFVSAEKIQMKNLLITVISVLTLTACSTNKGVVDEETLPKDISQKPHNNSTQEDDRLKMQKLIAEIDSLIATETCSDPTEWKFTAIGAKPCGGASSYIAYPKTLESEVVPKITSFTTMQSVFNTKYGLMSDCAVVPEPTSIRCENGRAALVGANSQASEIQ